MVLMPVLMAVAAAAVFFLLGAVLFRAPAQTGQTGPLWGGALVMLGALIGSVLVERPWSGNDLTQRRALDARSAELTARALEPGSPLACLDSVANPEIETACEKALFASPESVAAAIAYVDARISLMAAAAPFAERDPSYRPAYERIRRAMEADRFGLVAHVLVTRGCHSAGCIDLTLLRDTGHVLANMGNRALDRYVAAYAAAWGNAGSDMAALTPPAGGVPAGMSPATVGALSPPATIGAAHGGPKLDFPTAASIPAVSIMNAEPGVAASAESAGSRPDPRAKPAPAKRPQNQAARRQPEREAPPAPLPMSVLPPPPPPSLSQQPAPETR